MEKCILKEWVILDIISICNMKITSIIIFLIYDEDWYMKFFVEIWGKHIRHRFKLRI